MRLFTHLKMDKNRKFGLRIIELPGLIFRAIDRFCADPERNAGIVTKSLQNKGRIVAQHPSKPQQKAK
ncbi:MAG: hypothetical protein ACI80M_001473 [Gammaproteobacteria bacterium]|jgi:hypothetical protein|tara:strand:- start:337 stop:540 length:204 start_codon:yes stop_codon:yes gene_type:complete